MKIITWNVNGLRAVLGRNGLNWAWDQKPDVLCLQEVKARPDQLKEEHRDFPGYEVIWNPAVKAGYSGVATFLRSAASNMSLCLVASLPLKSKVECSMLFYAIVDLILFPILVLFFFRQRSNLVPGTRLTGDIAICVHCILLDDL